MGLLSAALMMASLATAQVPIGQLGPDGVTVKGRITDTFGEKFVIEDDSGRILVEMRVPPAQAPALQRGDTVLVTGLPRNRILDARRVVRENGEVIFSDPMPVAGVPPATSTPALPTQPAPASEPGLSPDSIARTLRSVGLTAVGPPVRHRKHVEIPARTATGTEVIVSLDRLGRLWEIEDAEHDNKNVPVRLTSIADAERALRQAGYKPRGEIERRKHHFEALVTNPRGEVVEVHMNLSGHVYKQTWLR
jgi:hypothetical protein